MQQYLSKIPHWLKNKYTLVTIVFLVFLLFLDDSNVFNQYKKYKEEQKLTTINGSTKLKIKQLQKIVEELQKTPLAIEKIGREKYGMKKPNETVFLFPDAEK